MSLSVAPSADLSVPSRTGCVLRSVPGSSQLPRANWTERLTAPFKFGAQELLPSAVKLGSAVTLTAVMRQAASQLGRQLLGHHMRYQVCAAASVADERAAVVRHTVRTRLSRLLAKLLPSSWLSVVSSD